MSRKKLEIKSGEKFGRLTVIEEVQPYIYSSGYKERRVKCRCDCGNTTIVILKSLRSGKTSSCGCYARQRTSEVKSKTKNNKYDLSDNKVGVGYTSKGERFLFDKEDFDIIKNYCWFIDKKGYVVAAERTTGKDIKLHRLIMNAVNGEMIDHIDHDRANNCKSNLRKCSYLENARNRSAKKDSLSGVTGVLWYKPTSKWKAQINISGKLKHLGYFTDINEAIRVRIKAELEFYKEYAPTYNYFTREQKKAILNDELSGEDIMKILQLNQDVEKCI